MSAKPLYVMLMGAVVILSTIAPVPTFAEFEKTEWNVQDLYKQCKYKGSLDEIFCLEFVFKRGTSDLYEWTGIERH